MKTPKNLLFLILLFIQIPALAQETTVTPEELTTLIQNIDLYYEQMISLKSTLAINGFSETSPKSELGPEVTLALETLQDNRLVLIDSIKSYRSKIQGLNVELKSLEELKYLFDVALIKSFLPRYDVAEKSIFARVFSSSQPQYVEELISRNEASTLFFSEFEFNESTKDHLNSSYRISELVDMHNAITQKINKSSNSDLYQVYSKDIKPSDGLEEARFYQSLVRGEDFSGNSPKQSFDLVLRKVASDHYIVTIALTCSGLFSL